MKEVKLKCATNVLKENYDRDIEIEVLERKKIYFESRLLIEEQAFRKSVADDLPFSCSKLLHLQCMDTKKYLQAINTKYIVLLNESFEHYNRLNPKL